MHRTGVIWSIGRELRGSRKGTAPQPCFSHVDQIRLRTATAICKEASFNPGLYEHSPWGKTLHVVSLSLTRVADAKWKPSGD